MKDEFHSSEYTPEDYKKNDFGLVVSSFEQIKKHQDEYATIFAEGSPRLKKLLNHLWDHDIETVGCCIGHKDAQVTYYKFHLFKQFERISKEDYEAHKHSWRYFAEKEHATPYFAYRPIEELPVAEQVKTLQERLKESLPDFDCFVDANKAQNMITIIHNSFLPELMREQFFKTLTEVFDQYLVRTKELQNLSGKKSKVSEQKRPLDEQLKQAQRKQLPAEKQQRNDRRKQPHRTDDIR